MWLRALCMTEPWAWTLQKLGFQAFRMYVSGSCQKVWAPSTFEEHGPNGVMDLGFGGVGFFLSTGAYLFRSQLAHAWHHGGWARSVKQVRADFRDLSVLFTYNPASLTPWVLWVLARS